MAFCTGCGKEVPAGAAACPGCGQATASSAPVVSASGGGLTDNVAAALAYIPIVGLLFLLLEPYNKNRFIRFHSVQSLFYFVAWCILMASFGWIPLLGFVIDVLLFTGFLGLWIVLALKAYQGQKFKLPVIGDIAEQQAGA